jgi:asparagine synthase (glutamine-hydrolysing)
MCGIAGFIDKLKNAGILEEMCSSISRRGPDDRGSLFDGGVALGHLRLSIIDLSQAGHQPMRFENLVIVFNGEIYNYKEIQKDLIGEGYHFQSSSDTEVVIKAFHCWGTACVSRFIGMFAFAVYNKTQEAIYIVRDRAGVKPLYYYHKEDRFAFGSELKSLKPYLSKEERSEIDTNALSSFLSVGYISNDDSIIKSVKKLPPAHYLKFSRGQLEVIRYWDVQFQENESWLSRKEESLLDELEALVISAFKYRMVADVPVGVFLSAGIDSSLVTAVLSKHFGTLQTFTIGFGEQGYDESGDAKKIAGYLNTVHTEARLTAGKAYEILDKFYDIYDEPHGDNSCVPTAYVSELAKNNGVKVVLSADAGDELFGGYVRYTEYLQRWNQLQKVPATMRKLGMEVLATAGSLMGHSESNRYARFNDILSKQNFIHFYQTIIRSSAIKELKGVFPFYTEQLTQPQKGAWLNQMCEWDFRHYMVDDILVKVDRATMYHSIEGREPFLDHRLVEFAAQLPLKYKIRNGETKYILKKLLGRYLPKELYTLPKRGFGAPLQLWIKEHYKDQFAEILRDSHPLFEKKAINQLVQKHQKGEENNYILLWYLFSFQLWYNKWTNHAC